MNVSEATAPELVPAALLTSTNLSFPALPSLLASFARHFRPRLRPPLSVWAEQNIVLSKEYAFKASALRLYTWQREMFDAFTDPHTVEITIACSTQTVKTLLIQCAMAYCIVEDQGPILIVQPKQDDAKAFSKERLGPMIRDCAVLRGLISDSEKEGNTILTKEFPGGSVALVGAISPGNLARRSIRYIFFDEVDKYPASAGKEGDPLTLGRERTITFGHRRKIVNTCSPTIAGRSRILKAYSESDRRKPYVPCWKCGYMQVLNFRTGVKWDSSLATELQPSTAYYQCSNIECGAHWDDMQRWASCTKTVWRADKPFQGHAGFWINHLYSPYKTLELIVKDFLAAKNNPQTLQAFINTTLAEAWEEEGSAPDPEILYGRREDYPHSDEAVIPMRGLFLTAAVDVQENPARLECEVKAWGRDRENWSVGYYIISVQAENGELLPVTSRELWDKLDREVLSSLYLHASGRHLPIMCMAIDTGRRPKPVYDFAARHARLFHGPAGIKLAAIRTVVPIKGNDDDLRIISAVSKEDAARKRQNVRIVSLGTHCIKQEIFDTLKSIKPKLDGSPSPACYHFPYYDMTYFEGLASEVRVVDPDDGSVEYRKRPGMRNEPLDLAVYNRGAASIVGIDRFTDAHWRKYEIALGINPASGAVAVPMQNDEKRQNLPENGEKTPNSSQIVQNSPPPLPSPLPARSGHFRSVRGSF